METIWAIVGIVVPALYGAGIVTNNSRSNARLSRALYWCSAAILSAWYLYWSIKTDIEIILRGTGGLLVIIYVIVVIPVSIRRASMAQSDDSETGPVGIRIEGPGIFKNNLITVGKMFGVAKALDIKGGPQMEDNQFKFGEIHSSRKKEP